MEEFHKSPVFIATGIYYVLNALKVQTYITFLLLKQIKRETHQTD